jgi:gamma-glutamyltranspeptidase/glutathione hydrolase
MTNHRSILRVGFILAWLVLLTTAKAQSPAFGINGMVVAQEPLAAEVGLRVLEQDGNAIDAAVAVGFTLAVTYPYAGNMGGGGFMTIRLADGRTTFIDFREKAPAKASHDMYLAPGSTASSTLGWRSSGVPGTVRGFELAWTHYGSTNKYKSWSELVQPAIFFATNGFALSASNVALFRNSTRKLLSDPESRSIFITNGDHYAEHAVLLQRDLGRTLTRIAADPNDFYVGQTARLLTDAMAAHDGLISEDDLRAYKAVERKPLEGDYHGYHIITAPPPSSGGICILQMLGMLAHTGYSQAPAGSAQSYHYLAEVMRRTFADRSEFLGDPDFMMPPITNLLAPAYLENRAAGISNGTATPTKDVTPGALQSIEGKETTHFNIFDKMGNAVAVTYTLNLGFGNGITVPGAGFLLNDEMDDFATKPGFPDSFGIMQGEKNAVAPNKRPLSSMSPTIVLRGDKPYLIVGAPGGGRIITAVLQVILNVIDHGMSAQEAVDAPRINHFWNPNPSDDYLEVERNIPSATTNELAKMGYQINTTNPIVAARVEAILIHSNFWKETPHTNGWIEGAHDWKRGAGKAAGY